MSQMNSYSYQPLAKCEIRLLLLKPGSVSNQLLILIQKKIPLSAAKGNYKALSYTWWGTTVLHDLKYSNGDSSKLHPIWNVLSDLRLETEPRKLWIDAICINQENHNERSNQVSIMRQIYQNAKRTTVQVGKKTMTPPWRSAI
jgi:hypothetical protein